MAEHPVATMVEILEQYQLNYPDLEIDSFLDKARTFRNKLLRTRWDTKLVREAERQLQNQVMEAANKAENVIGTNIISTMNHNNNNEDFVSQLTTDEVKQFESNMEQCQLNHPDIEIDSFMDKVRTFRYVVLQRKLLVGKTKWQLQDQVMDAANKAEDVIETHIISTMNHNNNNNEDFVSQLTTDVVKQFESIMEQISKIDDDDDPYLLPVDHLTSSQVPWYPKLDPHTKDDLTCIFQDHFQTLKSQLIHKEKGPSKLKIIAIHGMSGMGKRTLARRLFNDPDIVTHFHIRAWVTSPFEEDERGCLLNLLEGLGMLTDDLRHKDIDELKVLIRNALRDIKYCIVIHDVGDVENLVTFSRLFRNYRVGSRVLFTTIDIGEETLSTYTEPHMMRHMSDIESWLLFRHKIFGREHCPHELEPIGKIIVQLCRGIPQLVSLVAGVLATSQNTPPVWDLVATTHGRVLDTKKDIEEIQFVLLALIYYHLPNYLRPCLLYIGAFYESRDIKTSQIIKLWIAEGFVKQSPDECLEDIAKTYLHILIDKNLIYSTHREPNGRVTAFQSQILLRAGYWLLAGFEKFLGSKYLHDIGLNSVEEKLARRVSVHRLSEPCDDMELPLLARSLLSVIGASRQQVSTYLKLRLLRVLEVLQVEFYQFPIDILQQLLLRYLAFSCHSYLSNSFSILHNLQTLVICRIPTFRAFSLPSDLWGLTRLRHVKCKETFVLIDPKNGTGVVHWNLQTLLNMQLFGVTNQFLKQIPNIRNLRIFCNVAMETAFDLACLEKLETLKCSSDWSLASRNFLDHLTLPRSLRTLNLSLCRIPSKFMDVVGSLPKLELLKLQKSDFISASSAQGAPSWETAEREFPRLVSLEMLDLNLVHWTAKATHLPKLKHLIIRNCYALAEIPLDIGNIETLELIQADETNPTALVSAMQIQKEQEDRGNKFLQVRTHNVI